MNANDLISQILRRLDVLDPLTPIHWTRAEILVFVNDAIGELNLIAWEFQLTASLSVDATHNVYDNPATIIAPISVRDGKYLRRQAVSDLDFEVDWEKTAEQKSTLKNWSPIGLNKIIIHPRPLGAKTIYVEGLTDHAPVTDAAVALPVKAEYESAIEDYCVERATFKEGGPELQQVGFLYRSFLRSVQDAAGRNVIRMYPVYSCGQVDPSESLRPQVEEKQQ